MGRIHQSIRTGKPVAGATVSVLAVNGRCTRRPRAPTASCISRVQEPTAKRPQLYVVKKDTDLSFLPVAGRDRQLDFSRFDVDGERNAT